MASKYDDYKEDKTVTEYGDKTASYEKSMDGALKMLQQGTTYSTDMKDALNKVLNRQPFEYDMNSDALYNQYKNQYTDLGKQAMKDTTAQAADLTGGYGNSYGVTAGNQAYQGYLNQLNQMVPELYQIAQDRYNNETQQLMNNYSLIADADANEYARLQDNLASQQAMASYYGSRRDALAAEDYGRYSDNWNRAYQQQRDAVSDNQWQQQFDYQKERDAVADRQWQKEYDLSTATASSSSGSASTKKDTYTTGELEDIESYIDTYIADEEGNVTDQERVAELLEQYGLFNHETGDATVAGVTLWNKYFPETLWGKVRDKAENAATNLREYINRYMK